MSYQTARLGWLPDPRDHRDCDTRSESVRARLNQVVPVLSKNVSPASPAKSPVGKVLADLRSWCSPIENQGEIGSCTAHAVVGALEYFERKTHGDHVDASRRFLYRVTRRYLGWEKKGDTGAFLRSTIKALRLFGVVPEHYFPYDEAKYDVEPEAFHYAYAQNFKALEYFRVPENVHDLQQVLLAGLPFVFGFTCFNSIFDDDVGKTGVIPFPRKNEKNAGGHAVMAVGFTESHIIIRNSWAKTWGDNGYGYLPWTYFDDRHPLADDCWVLVNAAWMPEDEGEAFPTSFKAAAAAFAEATGTKKKKAKEASEVKPARPSDRREDASKDPHLAQVKVSRGFDPIRAVPMRFSETAGVKALTADPAAGVGLVQSAQPVALYLRNLKLLESFDFALFGEATNELYVLAVCWDLSGAPPQIFPSQPIASGDLKTYNLEKGDVIELVGDGIQLWPSQTIKGGLYVRIVIMESDDDVRAVGKQIAAVHDAVKNSTLTAALAPLAGAVGISAPALAAVGAAAEVLTTVIASALQKNDDDLVALFDGTYGAENVFASRSDHYAQGGAEITLDFMVGAGGAPKAAKKSAAKKTPKKKARSR